MRLKDLASNNIYLILEKHLIYISPNQNSLEIRNSARCRKHERATQKIMIIHSRRVKNVVIVIQSALRKNDYCSLFL